MLYLHSSFNCYVILPEGKNGFVVKSHEERVQLTASDKLAAIIKHSTAITRFWQRHFFFTHLWKLLTLFIIRSLFRKQTKEQQKAASQRRIKQ